MGTRDERGRGDRSLPKAMRHKRILDVAAEKPDASVEAIAEEVPSATADLVEHVLDEYGDPAADDAESDGELPDEAEPPDDAAVADGTDPDADPDPEAGGEDEASGPGGGDESGSDESGGFEKWTPDPDEGDGPAGPSEPSELTDKQREVLRAISDRPRATQREISDELGVSAATVSNRVNAIDGFEWADRRAIARELFDSSPSEPQRETTDTPTDMTTDESDPSVPIEQLRDRVATVERRIDDLDTGPDADSALDDPELAHGVLRACFESDAVTEEDELRLLKALLE